MLRPYFMLILGFLLGSLITGFIYSKLKNETQLRDFVLLYSKKAQDLFILKSNSNEEIVCLNYILAKGDVDILSNVELEMPRFFFSEESKEVIEQYQKTISDFNQINPEDYGCKDI